MAHCPERKRKAKRSLNPNAKNKILLNLNANWAPTRLPYILFAYVYSYDNRTKMSSRISFMSPQVIKCDPYYSNLFMSLDI